MRKFNDYGSMYPIAVFIIVLAVASVLILIGGEILTPFFNLMGSSDTNIAANVSEPRGFMYNGLQLIWPNGLLLAIFLGISFCLLMEYQKWKYKEGG